MPSGLKWDMEVLLGCPKLKYEKSYTFVLKFTFWLSPGTLRSCEKFLIRHNKDQLMQLLQECKTPGKFIINFLYFVEKQWSSSEHISFDPWQFEPDLCNCIFSLDEKLLIIPHCLSLPRFMNQWSVEETKKKAGGSYAMDQHPIQGEWQYSQSCCLRGDQ